MGIIAQHGMRGLSVVNVAKRVGLVTSGIYRHYQSKDALIDAVLDYIGARLLANVRAVSRMKRDASARLRSLLMKHADLIRANESIPQVVFGQEVYAGHPRRWLKLLGIIEGYLAEVARIVEAGQREGCFDKSLPPDTLTVMFLGMIQPPFIIWHLSAGAFDAKEHGKAADIHDFHGGLGLWSSPFSSRTTAPHSLDLDLG